MAKTFSMRDKIKTLMANSEGLDINDPDWQITYIRLAEEEQKKRDKRDEKRCPCCRKDYD